MKAIGFQNPLPATDPNSLEDFEFPTPTPGDHDLLVEVKAISVNPIDAKIRMRPKPAEPKYKVLGYDAAGVVKSIGPKVTLFKPGDAVYYAGSIDRPGTNSQFHLVHEFIVGPQPTTLSFAQAAALPLTTITAWELLFDRLQVRQEQDGPQSLLIVAGSGGVGSILIQLAKTLTSVTIIATASRPQTRQWCLDLGAHHVIDHTRPLAAQVSSLKVNPVHYVAALASAQSHWADICELLAPQGHVGLIEDAPGLDIMPLKRKCASLHWEFMFARPLFQTPDMIKQHELLTAVSKLVDAGSLRSTLGENFGPINAANLHRATQLWKAVKRKENSCSKVLLLESQERRYAAQSKNLAPTAGETHSTQTHSTPSNSANNCWHSAKEFNGR